MIHDVLLSCLNLYSKQLPIEEFVVSDVVSTFLHPCEKKILHDIIDIINMLRDIATFTKIYGRNHNIPLTTSSIVDVDEPLQNGLYLKAFANGIDTVLEEYFAEITELERLYLQSPTQSLLFIFQKLHVYEPLALFLRKLIRGIRMQKLHGCAIIQYLHQKTQHGDARIYCAMRTIQSAVNIVFLKQLTHWILYAKIVDSYGEFFIQCSEARNNSTITEAVSTGSGKHTTVTTMSEAASTYTDIWRYEICYEFLPHYLSANWAEKVLFIGQTVLIFKVDANKINKNAQIWNKIESNILDGDEDSLWNEKEHIYFAKIQALQNENELNVSHYERVVDEIKSYVTTRLSEIAVNQADLVQQLKLIKDFYLLGRGELFLEFIRQTYIIGKENDASGIGGAESEENKLRDFVKAFESAAHAVGVPEEVEQFSLCIPKVHAISGGVTAVDVDDTHSEFGYLQHVQLQYKINWPLHLLFSPKVIERYNVLFRFLLLIKKMQYDLHMIWCRHTRESKLNKSQNIQVMHLRNQLMFFVDNLQYYIQVDVLESQFSILLNTILNKADFEQIQRAHSIFQANVLSLCFLLTDEDTTRISLLQAATTFHSNNPVYIILNDIFHLCENFCIVLDDQKNSAEQINFSINSLDERFGNLIEQLINLLVGLKAAPSTTPLSQLLLRLDFNHWFSLKKKRAKKAE